MSVIFLSSVRNYFNRLIPVLYEKGYFGFQESAKRYVEDLFNDIETNLPKLPSKSAPQYFDNYGKDMEYAVFRKSKHTQWYVFFRVYRKHGEDIYQVRYIANNHLIAHLL
jgi:hypothetical protein